MGEDNKKGNGLFTFGLVVVLCFIAGVLTHWLIVVPIKWHIWNKLPKKYRNPWFKTMTHQGQGIITVRSIFSCFYYGFFWLFFAIIAINLAKGSMFENGVGPFFLFLFMMLGFLGMTIWIICIDIHNTNYENGVRAKEEADEDWRIDQAKMAEFTNKILAEPIIEMVPPPS